MAAFRHRAESPSRRSSNKNSRSIVEGTAEKIKAGNIFKFTLQWSVHNDQECGRFFPSPSTATSPASRGLFSVSRTQKEHSFEIHACKTLFKIRGNSSPKLLRSGSCKTFIYIHAVVIRKAQNSAVMEEREEAAAKKRSSGTSVLTIAHFYPAQPHGINLEFAAAFLFGFLWNSTQSRRDCTLLIHSWSSQSSSGRIFHNH